MRQPPRGAKEPLFGKRTFTISIFQGLGVLGVVLTVFAIAHYNGRADEEARALTFTTLVLANLALIFTNRSWQRTIPSYAAHPQSCVMVGCWTNSRLLVSCLVRTVLSHVASLLSAAPA